MDIFECAFVLVDIFFHPLQNYRKYSGMTYERDVYADDVDKKYVAFDVAYDKKAMEKEPIPIVVNIHGGGFVKGDKKHRISLSKHYASKGYFVVNVNYRLCPKHAFPTAIQDIFVQLAAIASLKDKYNIDTSKVVLTGDSAGAYYASLAYAASKDASLRQALNLRDNDLGIVGLMAFSGLYDCNTAFSTKWKSIAYHLATDLIGKKVSKSLEELKSFSYFPYMSPIDYVNKDWGKVLVSYAKRDLFVQGQSDQLVAKLEEVGVPYVLDKATELTSNHCYHLEFYRKSSKRCMALVDTYLKEIAE